MGTSPAGCARHVSRASHGAQAGEGLKPGHPYCTQPTPLCRQLCCCGVNSSQCTSPWGRPRPMLSCKGCAPTGREMPLIIVWRVLELIETTGVASCGATIVSLRTERAVAVMLVPPLDPQATVPSATSD